jgi:hypothetical protein
MQNNILDLVFFFFFVNVQCIQDLSCDLNINVGNWDSFEHTLSFCLGEFLTPFAPSPSMPLGLIFVRVIS